MLIKREDFKLKNHQDQTLLGRAILQPPFKASDALKNEARFVHVVNGNSKLYAPNGHTHLVSGDSIIMKCENFVNDWSTNADDSPTEVIVVHFTPQLLEIIYEGQVPEVFTSKKILPIQPVEKIPDRGLLDPYIKGLKPYFDATALITDEFLKVKIRELIHILIHSDSSGQIKAILSNLFQTTEYEFKEVIHSHLFENLNLEDLAFFAGLSLSSFKRKFSAVFGTSPTHYIKTKRLEKAEKMLTASDQRVSEIAYDCGFNDISYFSKSFTTMYQHSPTEYRKLHMS